MTPPSTASAPRQPPVLPKLIKAITDAFSNQHPDDRAAAEIVHLIQKGGEDPDQLARDGETALMAACGVNRLQTVAILLVHGADPGLVSHNGSSALSIAACICSPPLVRMLLHKGGEGVKRTALQHGLDRLWKGAQVGLELSRVMVYGRNPGSFDPNAHLKQVHREWCYRLIREELAALFASAQTPLEEQGASAVTPAPARDSSEGAQPAVDTKAEAAERGGSNGQLASEGGEQSASVKPEPARGGGQSAFTQSAPAQPSSPLLSPAVLLRLVEKGDVARLRQALELGADPNAANSCWITLLMCATVRNNSQVASLLLSTGRCDLERRSLQLKTAVHYSAVHGHLSMLQQLIAAGCDIESKDYADSTALMDASARGHAHIVSALIAAGASIGCVDVNADNALTLAAKAGHCDVITTLLDAGMDINNNLSGNGTALACAVKHAQPTAVQLLLSKGADPNVQDACCMTALDWAMQRGYEPMCQALRLAGGSEGQSKAQLRQIAVEAMATIDLKELSRDVKAILVPESVRQYFMATVEQATPKIKAFLHSDRGRLVGGRAGRGSGSRAQDANAVAVAGVEAAAASQPVRSSEEEAQRFAAELLAEEEAEKAKAQAKKEKRARQRLQVQVQAQAVAAAGVPSSQQQEQEQQQQQQQQQEQSAGASSSGGAETAAPWAVCNMLAPATPTLQMVGLSLGSASSPLTPQPGITATLLPSSPLVQRQQQQQQQQQPRSTRGNISSAHDDERLCVVCMDGPRCMVLVPCGHVVLCSDCCQAVQEANNESCCTCELGQHTLCMCSQ